jgi:hypothetical protein
VSSPIAGGRSAPWAVVVVMQAALGVPPVSRAVPCSGGGSSLGSGRGVPPGFNRVRQGPPRGGATGRHGGGVARAADWRQVPPMKVGSSRLL